MRERHITTFFINCQCVYCVSVDANVIVANIRLVNPVVRYNRYIRTGRARVVEMTILKMTYVYQQADM